MLNQRFQTMTLPRAEYRGEGGCPPKRKFGNSRRCFASLSMTAREEGPKQWDGWIPKQPKSESRADVAALSAWASFENYWRSHSAHPVMRFGVRNLNCCATRKRRAAAPGRSHPLSPCASARASEKIRAEISRKSLCMLRVCDHWHRQVYTCRAICTCD